MSQYKHMVPRQKSLEQQPTGFHDLVKRTGRIKYSIGLLVCVFWTDRLWDELGSTHVGHNIEVFFCAVLVYNILHIFVESV